MKFKVDCRHIYDALVVGSLVRLEWDDISGAINHEMSDLDISRCVSYGVVIEKNKETVKIAGSKYEMGAFVGDGSILPLGVVRSVDIIRPKVKFFESDCVSETIYLSTPATHR